MEFTDTETGKQVEAILLGFVGESSELENLSLFRDFLSEDIYPEKSKSFTPDVTSAITNRENIQIWGLESETHVEAVTEAELKERRP